MEYKFKEKYSHMTVTTAAGKLIDAGNVGKTDVAKLIKSAPSLAEYFEPVKQTEEQTEEAPKKKRSRKKTQPQNTAK